MKSKEELFLEELEELRRENRSLHKECEAMREELSEWQHYAILLTPEEICQFAHIYRKRKQMERERRERDGAMAFDKLLAQTAWKGGGQENAEDV